MIFSLCFLKKFHNLCLVNYEILTKVLTKKFVYKNQRIGLQLSQKIKIKKIS